MPTWAGPRVSWPPPSPWRGRTPWSRGSRCCRGRGCGTRGHRSAGTWCRGEAAARTLWTQVRNRYRYITYLTWHMIVYNSFVCTCIFNVRYITVLKSSPLDNRWWIFWTSPGSACLCACSCSAARLRPRVCTWWLAGNKDSPLLKVSH